jgi:hypothetical protein
MYRIKLLVISGEALSMDIPQTPYSIKARSTHPAEPDRYRMPYQSPPTGEALFDVKVTEPFTRNVPLTIYSIRFASIPRFAPSLVAACTTVPGDMVITTPGFTTISPVM